MEAGAHASRGQPEHSALLRDLRFDCGERHTVKGLHQDVLLTDILSLVGDESIMRSAEHTSAPMADTTTES